ncbi:hypothetical protein CC78DRAFT_621651 [Lojkania enalia]|uniref:NAD(P)-binding protein n=1 Tax=Lojkania enalia TaxID=147567 RepID=A0A9P4N1F6_9PLEO|nr:hypothetical protein CC78DRAFT_621651 [Didymosphaeria enalia]
MSPTKTIIIFGSGPGIGNHVASYFLSQNFTHAILLSCSTSRLESDKAVLQANLPSIPPTLKKIEQLTDSIDVVFFNAVRIEPSPVLQVPIQEIEQDFKTTNLALYLISQWSIPLLQSTSSQPSNPKPSLLVTTSHLPHTPLPTLLSLSLVKASQRNMVTSLSTAFPSSSGIHIGLVAVEGVVTPENKVLNPSTIAQRVWGFYMAGGGVGG